MTSTTKAARFTQGSSRFYRVDGELLPSVTSILACLAKPALVGWSGKVNREAIFTHFEANPTLTPKELRAATDKAHQNIAAKSAADLGTLAHARCEWLIQKMLGQTVGPDPIEVSKVTDDLPEDARNRALWSSMAFEDWVKANDVNPIATEIVVAHRVHKFAGTADLLACVNGRVAVIDLKTSSGVWPEMYMQLAAYRIAMVDDPKLPDPVDAYVLRLPKKESDPDFEAVKVDRLDAHLAGFLALRDVFLWQKECVG